MHQCNLPRGNLSPLFPPKAVVLFGRSETGGLRTQLAFPSMKLPRLKLWSLCLAVAASALVLKLALTVNALSMLVTPLLFFGPVCGIVVERQGGGRGIAGGVIAGILSGVAIATIMNIYAVRVGHPFAWFELAVSTAVFVMLEAFCGWFWGRTWHLSMANRVAANPKGNGA